MNKYESDILKVLLTSFSFTQKELADKTGYSLDIVNQSIEYLHHKGYINKNNSCLMLNANNEYKISFPQKAIILAAGFGMRMVPINNEIPKGLLEIDGEPIIERTIKQLHEVGIGEIYIVVGFMKERYEYLIEKYDVKIIVNLEYAIKNNLHSIKLVTKHLSNSYIIPCDIWCKKNPYSEYELYSWYILNDTLCKKNTVKVNEKMEIIKISDIEDGNHMIGIAYLTDQEAKFVKKNIDLLSNNSLFDNAFWEEALFENNKMILKAKIESTDEIVEINTYEQLRELDVKSKSLESDTIKIISKALNVDCGEIKNITVLKKGMTNRSFLFECKKSKYIMRIPGEGTDQLINRKDEYEVYQKIDSLNICDDIIYINPNNGYKITRFILNARTCDIEKDSDLSNCMNLLRKFHNSEMVVNNYFDIFEKIEFYESLRGINSLYSDYETTKKHIYDLKEIIDNSPKNITLTHIDAVPDNFLIYKENGIKKIKLIDWEYAAMQDPHVDLAMFCIYAIYDRKHVDHLIDIYFEYKCPIEVRIKIYCYIAVCGLLWSNWCEYKYTLGVEFGEYSLAQYRYAVRYYEIVQEELKKCEEYSCSK